MKPRFQGFREAVRKSTELDRILALPRRPPVDLDGSPRARALVEMMGERLRRPDRPPGAPCGCAALGRKQCIDSLLPAQAWALYEAPLAGGLIALIGVGYGKTLLDILMAMVMPNCKKAALFVPPGLVRQLEDEYLAIREHFVVPSLILPDGRGHLEPGRPALHVIPYSKFSRAESTDLLEQLDPDLVLADEIHLLKNRESARTMRVLRRFAAAPETRLCGWSGTAIADSIDNVSHLLAFSLGEGSPLPLDPDVVQSWSAAVDPSDWPAPPGALTALGDPGESVRAAVARRIVETRGVVSTKSSSAGATIVLRDRRPPVPESVTKLIKDLRATWMRPDGEELIDALSVARCARELACGFFYRWRFPGKPNPNAVAAWFAARKAWHKELREKLKHPEPHMDSPLLLAKAAIRHYADYAGDLPVWESEAWPLWRDLRDSVQHETEAVWVDDYLVKDAAAWAKATRGIVWYEHDAFGRAVAEESGLPLHGGGPGAEERIRAEKGDRSIIAAIRSHGVGRDGLQHLFAAQLVTNPPPSGEKWEQLLGRLSRQGQRAEEILTVVYRQTAEMAEAVDKAIELAKFVHGITGAHQKLLSANVEFAWH